MPVDKETGMITEGLAQVLPISTNEVFYNPVQVFNRDLSIMLTSLFAREVRGGSLAGRSKSEGPVRVLEGLAASGLRSVRYSKELRFGDFEITANDIEAVATERIAKNVALNAQVETSFPVTAINSDAIVHLHLAKDTYEVIDLDPYGSASPFLDAAMGAVRANGLVCVTSTDGGVLCGNQPEMAYARYGGFALKENYCHEMGLRVLLHAVAAAAARHRRGIRILAAFSIDFYFRIFVQVLESPAKALGVVAQTGLVMQCVQCEFHQIQNLTEMSSKPARFSCPSVCPECQSQLSLGGPMWTGPTYDPHFLQLAMEQVNLEADFAATNQAEFPGISSWVKIRGLLHGLQMELPDVPLFYTIPGLTRSLKCSPPKLRTFCFFLRQLGYRVGASHRVPNSVKTDAPASVVYDLLRIYVQGLSKPVFPLNPQLLAKPISTVIPAELEMDFSRKIISDPTEHVPVYIPNPTPFWGPKPRAAKRKSAER